MTLSRPTKSGKRHEAPMRRVEVAKTERLANSPAVSTKRR